MFQRTLSAIALTAISLFQPNFVVAGSSEGGVAANCHLSPLGGGATNELRDLRGQVVYLDFWASWCGPCVQSFPYMNKLHQDLAAQGLKVIAVNLDENPEEARAFLAQHPVDFTVAVDRSGQCPAAFGVKAMPSSYLIDRQGVVRQVHLGFRPGEGQQFRTQVEQLLTGPHHASRAPDFE